MQLDGIKEKEDYVVINSYYGKDISQYGDLYLPKGNAKGTICLFHGGFWKMPYDLHQMDLLCEALIRQGFIVWNIEYRRTGVPERKWTDPFEDSVRAINHLVELSRTYGKIDLNEVTLMGHSAGGHLALCLGCRNNILTEQLKLKPISIVGLAPVVDMIRCYRDNSGSNAVEELLQCTPAENISRYNNTSPIELLPMSIPAIVFHGDKDEYLSIEMARRFAEENSKRKTDFSLVEIRGGSHMDFIDPDSVSVQDVMKSLLN